MTLKNEGTVASHGWLCLAAKVFKLPKSAAAMLKNQANPLGTTSPGWLAFAPLKSSPHATGDLFLIT